MSVIDRKDFLRGLQLAKGAKTSEGSIVEVLSMFLIDNDVIQAYDDVLGITVNLDSDTDIEGVVPGDLIINVMNGYSGERVSLEQSDDGEFLFVKSEGLSSKFKATVPLMAKESWLWSGPPTEKDPLFTIEVSKAFFSGMKSVMVSMAATQEHGHQSGITLESDGDGEISMYSTDRATISAYRIDTESAKAFTDSLILPPAFCNQFLSIYPSFVSQGGDGDIELIVFDDCAVVDFGGEVSLFTRLIDPSKALDFSKEMDRVIGDDPIDGSEIPEAFLEAINRALLFASDSKRDVQFDIKGKELKITAGADSKQSVDTLDLPKRLKSRSFKADPSYIKRAIPIAKEIDFRSEKDRCIILSNEDEYIHLIGVGSGN